MEEHVHDCSSAQLLVLSTHETDGKVQLADTAQQPQ